MHFWSSIKRWVCCRFVLLLILPSPWWTPHWPRLCQPACCYWCHPFCCCTGLSQIYGNQQDQCIHLSSAINCSFSFSVGLMTLTLGRGMGLKALTEGVKLILSPGSIYYSITIDNDCHTTVDGREKVMERGEKKAILSKMRKEEVKLLLLCMHK